MPEYDPVRLARQVEAHLTDRSAVAVLRMLSCLTQAELAARAVISRQSLHAIERGTDPSVSTALAIVAALNEQRAVQSEIALWRFDARNRDDPQLSSHLDRSEPAKEARKLSWQKERGLRHYWRSVSVEEVFGRKAAPLLIWDLLFATRGYAKISF